MKFLYVFRASTRLAAAGLSILLLGIPAIAPAETSTRPTPVEVVTPKPPTPVTIEGQEVLVYELHITNFGSSPLTLREIHVDALDGKPASAGNPPTELADYSGASLLQLLHLLREESHTSPGVAGAGDAPVLDVGQRMIAFMYLNMSTSTKVTSLRHRFVFEIVKPSNGDHVQNTESVLDNIIVPVLQQQPMVLIPPFKGGVWLAGNGPSNDSAHRRSIIAIDGRPYISQRFAIDWVMVGDNGDSFHDSRDRNENFWAFGQPVLAVHDGEVTEVVDDIPDNDPGKPPSVVTIQNILGNHVILRIAPDVYVTYCHLQRGSILVHLNQTLKRGEELGLVGSSGNTTAPHLHFQVTNGDSALASEGIPFVFDDFRFFGFGKDFEPGKPHPDSPRTHSLPVDDSVVAFR